MKLTNFNRQSAIDLLKEDIKLLYTIQNIKKVKKKMMTLTIIFKFFFAHVLFYKDDEI